MVERNTTVWRASSESILATNTVIRNTYILLGASLLFSALMAGVAMAVNAPPLGLITLLVYFGLLFAINATRNSAMGIFFVFALTGFMGFTLGPILNMFIHGFSNGAQLVATALGGTGLIFFALSGYALTTRQNFSYLGGFLMAGFAVMLLCIIVSLFWPMPMLHLAMSAAFILLSSGVILYETSNIIHGGQTNYIMATVSLFVALYNIFISLLQLLSFFAGNRD